MSGQAQKAELETLDGERGVPSVALERPSAKKRASVLLVTIIGLAMASAMGYWKVTKHHNQSAGAAPEKTLQLSSAVPARTFNESPGKTVAPPLPEQFADVVPAAGVSAPALPGGIGGLNAATVVDKSSSSLMVEKPTGRSASEKAVTKIPAGLNALDGQGGMAPLLGSTRTARRSASNLGNRNFLLAKGAFIDCALQTRLDSTVPGMTACVVTRNVYSDNGKVLLIDRGSTVSGEYRSNLRQGMARLYVLWNRIKTPSGVVIDLDSPGTDPLGGSGLPGHVDNHFWQRFGGALLLSLVDDTARGLSSTVSSSGRNQFNFTSTGEATQDIAAEALKHTIDIPPTLTKNQGEQIGIYIARDLDFSTVYDVEAD